jgi:uncharacterized membrane protein
MNSDLYDNPGKATTRQSIIAFFIALFLYLIFFNPLLSSDKFFWDSDAEIKHYPTREYLYRVIRNEKRFPLWTEKVLFGHAIYTDMENAYFNPINVLTIILSGPIVSYKIVHFMSIMIGSLALFHLLSKKGIRLVPYVAAVLIYYYSFFHLNHLIHLNLIAVSLIFPLNILLADCFINTLEKKYIYLQALVLGYGLLWGHPQTSILVFIGILLYILVVGGRVGTKTKTVYLLSIIVMSVGMALPQFIPSAKAYIKSYRNLNDISSSQGSLTPELSLSYIFPYIYGTYAYYYGEDISEEYSYTELYNYVGIVALLLAPIYILFGKKDRLFYFSYSLVIMFLVLAYLKYIPILDIYKMPVISAFRYWTRSVFLFIFSLSLITAFVLNNSLQISKIAAKKYLLLLTIPIIYLLFLSLCNLPDTTLQNVHSSLINYKFNMLLKRDILIWLLLPTVTLFVLFIGSRFIHTKHYKFILKLTVLLLIFADYKHFDKDVLDYRIKKWNWESGLTFPLYYNNTRVIDENVLVRGMKPLLRSVYTPYGYSQFIDKSYWLFFDRYNLGKSPRVSYTNDYLRQDLDVAKLKDFGITYVRTGKMEYILRNPETSPFFKEEIPSTILLLNEGHIIVKVKSNSKDIFTTIKYDSNWNVKVNNKSVRPEIWEDIFMKIEAPLGESILEFEYIPQDLYLGFFLGTVTLLSSFFFLRKCKFKETVN